ncbi:YjgB family protein [Paenibacillus sacheonensis]|uniref:DUF4309 domain-containing protein n=1 Tax=Paenibacillus sacheonensis TaxID=742054 RepID=A0A7X5C0X5_9BACL|nr:YjgB family protein [Paenibacillus sacheonensis]MBM7567678.1 hypothetical protein [Paenibacillus sacheonensis]NBC72046.1 DUF4309 domain-containing protein [Paenibacillus sacheonensis]
MKKHASKIVLAVSLSGLFLVSGMPALADAGQAAKQMRTAGSEDAAMALKTLNSFYKPALVGQFPGSVKGLKVGTSTRKQVIGKIGQPDKPRSSANGYDRYHAEMGRPGYAIAYRLNKVREMRYFGTNVERQTNIGGITKRMLFGRWGKPAYSVTIRNGSLVQQKVVYKRGKYNLAFIFDSSTDLDHINLLKR